jgi:RNA polymerase sigma factor (sigma-70 family)
VGRPPTPRRRTSLPLPELEQLDEEELVCRAQAGSSASFGVLSERYRPRLLRMLSTRLAGADAEDLVQEALARAFANIRSYEPTGPFPAWLFTIAVRLAASHGRRRRQASGLAVDPADASGSDPAAVALQAQERENLWAAAATVLSATQYEAMWLRYGREMPVREVAKAMRITKIHAKVLLYRARRRLLSAPGFAEFGP